MKKTMLLILSIILLIFLIGCLAPTNPNVCGDDSCTLTEDCNTCAEDCKCGIGEYCSEGGICRKEAVCGDEICLEKEKSTCCEDCGCAEGVICNKVTQKCQEKIEVSEDLITKTVDDYLQENKISGKIIKTIDTYYKEQSIKETTIDCKTEGIDYPCQIILFINEKGEIVEEIRTA